MTVSSNPRKIYQSGSSLVVSFPEEVMNELGVEKGDRVAFEAEDGEAVVRPVTWEVDG